MKQVSSVFIISLLCLGLVSTTQAAEKKFKLTGNPGPTTIDYTVRNDDSQMVTFDGLSSRSYYSLACYPDTHESSWFTSDVYVSVKTRSGTYTATFGGPTYDTVALYNLEPFYVKGTYSIQYEVTTNSMFSQKGYCVFQ